MHRLCMGLLQWQGSKRPVQEQSMARLPRNAPGNGAVLPRETEVTGSPRCSLRICQEAQSPLRICCELAVLNPQVLYNY